MKKAITILMILGTTLGGCSSARREGGGAPSSNTANTAASSNTAAPRAQMSEMPVGGGGGGGHEEPRVAAPSMPSAAAAPAARKIVRNAELQLETDAPEAAQQKIAEIAETRGGFVVESQQSTSDARAATRDTVTMTVRVPAEKFAEAIAEIRKTAARVVVETIKSDDVTEEFIDTEADLRAKRALEAQFLEIMKRANTVEDALGVQRELADVRGELERLEGRRRFLENQAALSTVKIRIQTPAAITASSNGFGERLKEALGDGFDAALNFILGLVAFLIAILPFLIFIVLPIYLLIRYALRKRHQRKTAAGSAGEEPAKE